MVLILDLEKTNDDDFVFIKNEDLGGVNFDFDDARDFVRENNINGQIKYRIIQSSDELDTEVAGIQKKRKLERVLEDVDTSTLYTFNPIQRLFSELELNEYYCEEEFDNLYYYGEHIPYGENLDINIKIHGEEGAYVKMSIHRLESGSYELTTYANFDKPEPKKRRRGLKI